MMMAGAVEPGAPGGFFNMIPMLNEFVPFYIWKCFVRRCQWNDFTMGKNVQFLEEYPQWMQNLVRGRRAVYEVRMALHGRLLGHLTRRSFVQDDQERQVQGMERGWARLLKWNSSRQRQPLNIRYSTKKASGVTTTGSKKSKEDCC